MSPIFSVDADYFDRIRLGVLVSLDLKQKTVAIA